MVGGIITFIRRYKNMTNRKKSIFRIKIAIPEKPKRRILLDKIILFGWGSLILIQWCFAFVYVMDKSNIFWGIMFGFVILQILILGIYSIIMFTFWEQIIESLNYHPNDCKKLGA